jgi:hypothetical protein
VIWWWLSFCDPKRPHGQEFLGVAVVPALDFGRAVRVAWALGCNPGGAVRGWRIPAGCEPAKQLRNRLLTSPTDLAAAGAVFPPSVDAAKVLN